MTKNFPLLTEIDQEINSDNIDWNKNAFQTLLVGLDYMKIMLMNICFFSSS